MSKSKRVVVTGIGPITSAGIGVDNLWNGVLEKKTGLTLNQSSLDDEEWDDFYFHEISDFNFDSFNLDTDILEYIEDWKEGGLDKDLQYLLGAIKLALDDGKIDYRKLDNELGLIVTHESPGMETFFDKILYESFEKLKEDNTISRKKFYDYVYHKTVKQGYETQSFMTLFHIAKVFNVHKHSLFINNACASGLFAVESASDMIKLGKVPLVVTVAGDHSNIYKYLWFKAMDMYEEDGKIKPFSNNGKGLVMGEGAAALVLEEYDHALQRNAKIYAEYIGGGFSLEGWQVTRPKIGGDSYYKAIKEAIANSHIQTTDIDLICLHGFGTKVGDYYEAKAIMDIFDKSIPATAFKPYVGHNLGGSALIETAILLLAIENNIIPPILNTKKINPQIDLNLILNEMKNNLNCVMKTCSAFAGYNAATIFRKIK